MTLFDHSCETLDGTPFNLHALKGQVLLVVNVASRCGFTPQLKELEALYQHYRDQGLVVLAFPCNQFGHQAPEEGEAFAEACSMYRLSFPLLQKVKVNGSDAHPLFKQLKKDAPGLLRSSAIKWNFTKFLVNRDGQVIERFGPRTRPMAIRRAIEQALDGEVPAS
ncbi:glutathione peroxidase [Carnimonas bestiolae]|uniref:glutathione peroxidase n=1 Tax=Carnimonas bestiolae TaxID=3402172 RepID=UPI003EDC313F